MSTAACPEDKAGHLPPNWGKRLSNNLAVGWIEVLKDFFNHTRLVDEADDSHFPLAFWTDKGIRFIDLSDEMGPKILV